MTRDRVIDAYFEWMYDIVCGDRFAKQISYRKLLAHLHDTEFIFLIPKDQNRAEDGVHLRYRFASAYDYDVDWTMDILDGPCSVLEMMIALSIRCEENIMDDDDFGNRTGQWFWGMVVSLGLGSMIDDRYSKNVVESAINKFLYRDYEPNGRGGLFTIRHCEHDLRDVEIWHQLCWYLDSIV
jgi:hypothetical protein